MSTARALCLILNTACIAWGFYLTLNDHPLSGSVIILANAVPLGGNIQKVIEED